MMASWKFKSNSEAETQKLGHNLGNVLAPGLIVSLNGNLGAGKTRLVQGIAEALDVDRAEVTSPTFTLIQEYAGRIPLYHFDTYRLNDVDEFEELGASEIFEREAISLIEWGDRVADFLPEPVLRIEVQIITPEQREFCFEARHAAAIEVLNQLKQT